VGGVSGRPTREREEEQSSPRHSRRNGGRHPGSRDAGSLRGMSEKRGPRPVRTSLIRGLFLLGRAHRRQRVSSGSRRRGTSSACARRTRSARESSNSRSEDTSFARSRDPCSSIVTEARLLALDASRGRQAGVARSIRYRGRASSRKREEPAPGSGDRTQRGSPRVTALLEARKGNSEEVVRDASEKEGGPGLRPCEESRAPVSCPYVVSSCRNRQAVSGLE
jgi:hypothetical protein